MNMEASPDLAPQRHGATRAAGSYRVLLVDDSEDDRLFMRRALRDKPEFVVIGELRDGEAAIHYLGGQGAFANRAEFPYPDVLLLDLKMPRKTGHEVLEWLQGQRREKLCVVVMSGSFLPKDITRSRELGADAYFTKEALFEQQKATITEIENLLRGAGPSP
jgi:CheY-like chemotaxis protein